MQGLAEPQTRPQNLCETAVQQGISTAGRKDQKWELDRGENRLGSITPEPQRESIECTPGKNCRTAGAWPLPACLTSPFCQLLWITGQQIPKSFPNIEHTAILAASSEVLMKIA